ncbi:intradiol ring-cleavage dioxygenase [Antarcticibacterium arcticum]|uniref:Intradiol ring-cleavage dioxygenase n=1 Tax=Antarcticibacterium arcticum TaxID=2585771 RepID=A0A5B8YKA1_9FLAO|nr:intradiol ring-cleavage dioxygenase [Antarcticibacterium arcticum]QED38085.1 intradiol ring-cleavage dioxygenase [Antarcticibacterium arcticum]
MDIKFRTLKLGLFLTLWILTACNAQTKNSTTKLVGGGCEGCEAIFEYGDKKLTPTDTLPEFENNEPKLEITGTVLKKDGKTPAENVILYIYHTNRQGIYETKGKETGWAKRHGFIRGWIKTGKDGKYAFYTFRPAAYPNGSEPEHIHITVKEPDKNEYYLDDYLFDDDPQLTKETRKERKNRGGSGIIKPKEKNGIVLIERNIILGKNIPNYE